MTVAGLQTHYAGDQSVLGRVWESLSERWDEFERIGADDETFGVMTNVQPDQRVFDYVAGVATERPGSVPNSFVVVEVPGGTYARFETALASMEADYARVTEEWLPDSPYERRPGPEFERYGDAYDPGNPDSPYDYFVPVTPVGSPRD